MYASDTALNTFRLSLWIFNSHWASIINISILQMRKLSLWGFSQTSQGCQADEGLVRIGSQTAWFQRQSFSMAAQSPSPFDSVSPVVRVPCTEHLVNKYLLNEQMSECVIHFKCISSISNYSLGKRKIEYTSQNHCSTEVQLPSLSVLTSTQSTVSYQRHWNSIRGQHPACFWEGILRHNTPTSLWLD